MGLFDFLKAKPEIVAYPETDDLYRVNIVGEASYQPALLALAGPKTEDGVSVWKVATLSPEPSNPYDRNAVACHIEGELVGYLARAQAVAYGRLLGGNELRCAAEIRGGWLRLEEKNSHEREGHFGVALYLPLDPASALTPDGEELESIGS